MNEQNIEINDFMVIDENDKLKVNIEENEINSKEIKNKDTKELSENVTKEVALETIIKKAIQLPGVRVDRDEFLAKTFVKETDNIERLIEEGPVNVGIEEKKLRKIAEKLILRNTSESSIASFAMGIPGGITWIATLPADLIQFYGITLKTAQELTYLYGATDLWKDGQVDEEKVRNQLLLYCGVMFGVSGATAGVRVLSTQIAKTTLKKLPQKALTKTFWYPIIKKIGKSVGLKITKKTFANGVTKVIPVVSGVISGAMTFLSMKPMTHKLLDTLEKVNFHYTEEEFNKDIETIDSISENEDINEINEKEKKKSFIQKGKDKISNLLKKKDKPQKNENIQQKELDEFEKVKKLKELLDMGAITKKEFEEKKKQILGL